MTGGVVVVALVVVGQTVEHGVTKKPSRMSLPPVGEHTFVYPEHVAGGLQP